MRLTGIRRHMLAATLLGLAAGPVAGCGPDGPGGQLALKINYNPGVQADGLRSNDPPATGTAPADITDYRICVSGPDGAKPKCQNFNRADHPSGAKLGGLKPGSERTVTFQGYDVTRDYEVRWCGNAANVEVKSNKTTQVSMYISVCSDFTEVRNTMDQPRAFHTATRLSDGRVMVIGGFSSLAAPEACLTGGLCHKLSATSSIDIYDPRTGQFEPTSGLELTRPRAMHTATLLPDGKVLVAGGAGRAEWRLTFPDGGAPVLKIDLDNDDTQAGNSAELIDPVARTATEINLTTPRAGHRAVSLSNGDVLLVGGISPADNSPLASLSRYEVSAGAFADEGATSLNVPRQGAALAKFADRSFLLWGGNHADNPEPGVFAEILFEEADGSPFVLTPQFILNQDATQGDPAFYAAAASPRNNEVLACGGMIVDAAYDPSLNDRVRILNTFRLADMTPQGESFVDIGAETMRFMRAFHSATLLPDAPVDGEIVVAGGVTRYDAGGQRFGLSERVEFFSPAELIFEEKQIDSRPVELSAPRAGHAVATLEDGTLFICGGLTDTGTGLDVSDTAEIYNPAPRSLRVE